jgi:hypothetical protein
MPDATQEQEQVWSLVRDVRDEAHADIHGEVHYDWESLEEAIFCLIGRARIDQRELDARIAEKHYRREKDGEYDDFTPESQRREVAREIATTIRVTDVGNRLR